VEDARRAMSDPLDAGWPKMRYGRTSRSAAAHVGAILGSAPRWAYRGFSYLFSYEPAPTDYGARD